MFKKRFDYPILQPPFKFVPYEEMTKAQAKQCFDWLVSEIPNRLALLRKMYSHEMGRQDLDYTFESLVPFWIWMRRHVEKSGKKRVIELKTREAVKGPPVRIVDQDLTFTTLALVQDAGMYVAEIFMKEYPFIHWTLSEEEGKETVNYNLPVLAGLKYIYPKQEPEPAEFNPERQVLTCVWKYLDDGNTADDLLLNVYKRWRDHAEKSGP